MSKNGRDKIIKIDQMKMEQTFSQLSKSQYSLKDVLDLQQFRQLSQEIKLENQKEDKLVNEFYWPTWKNKQSQFERKQQNLSAYQSQYLKWKEDKSNKNSFQDTYQSALLLINKQKQKQQVNRLIKQYSLDSALLNCSQYNQPLIQIAKSHEQSLQRVINKPLNFQQNIENPKNIEQNYSFMSNPISHIVEQNNRQIQANKQRLIEFEVQKQLLQKIKRMDEAAKKQELKAKKQRQLRKSCFIDLIERPPTRIIENKSRNEKINQIPKAMEDISKTHSIPQSMRQSRNSQPQKAVATRYKLNVKQILKMPPRLFLIFYSENYHQIVRLSTPQELQSLNKYRNEALNKQQALNKLKKKVADEGPELISKLLGEMKEKLFRILYEKDVQEENYYQQKQ